MKNKNNRRMNLIIDVGNSRAKLAVFEEDNLVELLISSHEDTAKEIKNICKRYVIKKGIISTVVGFSADFLGNLNVNVPFVTVSSSLKLPFKNLYHTPNTLGVDRIALVVAALKKYPQKNVLIIDAGTCITFDFITKEKEYLGGAISPGIEMRFKSLHHFTSKLPLLTIKKPASFIGKSTEESMNSGVLNGVIYEIEGVIKQYENKYKGLTVVLTGGDTKFLLKQLKSSIFANQNFLLEGLNEILIFNKAE